MCINKQDYALKFGLLDDLYSIIDVEGKLGGALPQTMGGFDLIYANGERAQPGKPCCYTSRLGNFQPPIRTSMPPLSEGKSTPQG